LAGFFGAAAGGVWSMSAMMRSASALMKGCSASGTLRLGDLGGMRASVPATANRDDPISVSNVLTFYLQKSDDGNMSLALAKDRGRFRRSVRFDSMGRPSKPKDYEEVVLSVRVDKKLVDELDALAATITPGTTQSRTQMVKRALREWLDAHKRTK
jgi:hypothetical protein